MKERQLPLLMVIDNPDFANLSELEKYGEALWIQLHRRTKGQWTSDFSERISGEYAPPPKLAVIMGATEVAEPPPAVAQRK